MLDKIINEMIYLSKLLSKNKIKIILLFALFFGIPNHSNAQKKGNLKTISFGENEGDYGKEYDYIAIGYLNNDQFIENEVVTFLTNRNHKLADTIVSGRFFYENGNSYIDGIWKKYEFEGGNRITRMIRCQGIFKVSNNKNGIGITINRKVGVKPIIKSITNTSYNLEILDSELKLKTDINNIEEAEINSNIFEDYILKSKYVKLTFKNGDLFNGTVKINTEYSQIPTNYVPNYGEYKYYTGEVANGEIYYSDVFHKFLLYKGSIIFNDGSIDNENWLEKYNFHYIEMAKMYSNNKSLTEIRNKAKSIGVEKEKKIQEKKILQEQLMEKIRQNKQRLKAKLESKYGKNIGNKLLQGKLEAGMSKSMVSEVWKEEYFSINNIVRNSQNFEVWEFNSGKMAQDLVKEYGEDDAYKIYFSIAFANEFGEISIPRKLIFKNDKLTDVF